MTQVIAADYDSMEEEEEEPFRERNLKVFTNTESVNGDDTDSFNDRITLHFCDTFEDLRDNYFINFHVDGLVFIY